MLYNKVLFLGIERWTKMDKETDKELDKETDKELDKETDKELD